MQPVLILLLMLAFWPPIDPPPLLPIGWTLGSLLLGLAVIRALAELPSLYLAIQLRLRPERRYRWLWWYYRWRQIHFGILTGMYVFALLGLHWATFVRRELGLTADWILLDEFLILLPFLLGLLLSWDSFYRVEKTLAAGLEPSSGRRFWRRSDYLLFQARQQLGLVLLPLTLFMGLQEAAHWAWPHLMVQTIPQISISLAIAAMVLAAMPWLLTKIFQTSSLPDGPLRDRLIAAADRLRFPFSDICVWHTRHGLANAMVTGFLPRPRYILLSDLLLEQLEPDEIEAVFCHEIGHIRHRHIALYLVFMGLSVTVLTQLLDVGLRWFPGVRLFLIGVPTHTFDFSSVSLGIFLLGSCLVVGGYIRLFFGVLSRNCERQADVFSCKNLARQPIPALPHVPVERIATNGHAAVAVEPTEHPTMQCDLRTGVPVFVSALEKVADMNGIAYTKPSWRHGSIAQRVAFLRRLAAHPQLEIRQQQAWLFMKTLLLLTLTCLVFGLLWLGAYPLLMW